MDILELLNKLSLEKNNSAGKIEYIVAGLGNPGNKYDGTRHNAGFVAADAVAKKYGGRFSLKSAHRSEEAEVTVCGKRVLLLKPQTLMNNSGEGISLAANFYKIPAEKIIVMYDDIALEPGILRFREKGSAGGHNGMKSIIKCLGTDEFPRIRIGVGAKPSKDYDLADHVLGKMSKEDSEKVTEAVKRAVEALPTVLDGDISTAQSKYCR